MLQHWMIITSLDHTMHAKVTLLLPLQSFKLYSQLLGLHSAVISTGTLHQEGSGFKPGNQLMPSNGVCMSLCLCGFLPGVLVSGIQRPAGDQLAALHWPWLFVSVNPAFDWRLAQGETCPFPIVDWDWLQLSCNP